MASNFEERHTGDIPSIWAAVTPPGPAGSRLEGTVDIDAVVIGAGFTGLSTALHLRKAGIEVALLEAVEPGWGGSGRNNGQVIPTLSRPDPDDLVARYGAAGERFVALLRDCASVLFGIVAEHHIAAEAEQTGWVQPVHSPGRIKIAERRYRQWQAHGAAVELLDAAATQRMTGSDAWHGGFWNRTGGHINPLALARGLARTVQDLGATLYCQTPALRFERQGSRWHVQTPTGLVRARTLMLATNAYTDAFSAALAPRVAHQVVPVVSWQMATQPLSEAARAQVIPARQALSDTHGELYFARYDARNRLVTGGNLLIPINERERLCHYVGERLRRLWPVLDDVRFDYVWNGNVGMTDDFLPRFHKLGPAAWAWAGCNGRAVGLSMALGREFARAMTGASDDQLALPFTDPKPLPLRNLARRIAPFILLRYRRLDRKEI